MMERKYLNEFVPDAVAIKATDAMEKAVKVLVQAAEPDVNFDLSLKVDGHEQVWRFVAGKTGTGEPGVPRA